jgi:hypothetical protein
MDQLCICKTLRTQAALIPQTFSAWLPDLLRQCQLSRTFSSPARSILFCMHTCLIQHFFPSIRLLPQCTWPAFHMVQFHNQHLCRLFSSWQACQCASPALPGHTQVHSVLSTTTPNLDCTAWLLELKCLAALPWLPAALSLQGFPVLSVAWRAPLGPTATRVVRCEAGSYICT